MGSIFTHLSEKQFKWVLPKEQHLNPQAASLEKQFLFY